MIPDVLLVAWSSVLWTLLSIVVFFVCILLTVIILVQDSKDTGLTSAFGGGGGGNALLGARMQKDLAKLTAILAVVLAACLFVMGFLTIGIRKQSVGTAAEPEAAMAPEEPAVGAPEAPGDTPEPAEKAATEEETSSTEGGDAEGGDAEGSGVAR